MNYEVTTHGVALKSSPEILDDNSNIISFLSKGTKLTGTLEENYLKTDEGYVLADYIAPITSGQPRMMSARAATTSVVQNATSISQATSTASLNNTVLGKSTSEVEDELIERSNAFCTPPQFCEAADPYINSSVRIGRVYRESILDSATIVSLCPCRIRYLPSFSKEEQQTFLQQAMAAADQTTGASLNNDFQVDGSGMFYDAVADINTYISRVNASLRLIAILMGIGDNEVPGTKVKYKYYSWDAYNYPTGLSGSSATMPDSTGILGSMVNAARNGWSVITDSLAYIKDGVMDDGVYFHFYADGDGTSYSDEISTGTRASMLESTVSSTLDELSKELNYMMGELGTTGAAADMDTMINQMGDSWIGNVLKTTKGYFHGARLAFPQLIDNSSFGRSITVQLKCVATSGDPESIYLRTIVPQIMIMCMAVPGQYSANMYTFPPIVKINCPGWFNCDMGVISDLRINRGGTDDRAWSSDRLASEVNIQFSITPLYSQLMMPSTKKPFSALFNTSFVEYAASLSGLNMKKSHLDLKGMALTAFLSARYRPDIAFSERVRGFSRAVVSSEQAHFIRNLFQLGK